MPLNGNPGSLPWSPLLSGALASRAQECVEDVAQTLNDHQIHRVERESAETTLGMGSAGIALFYSYLSRAFPDAGHEETAFAYLDEALDGMASRSLSPSLYHGVAGIAWLVEHLNGWLLEAESEDEDPNSSSDEFLLDALKASPWEDDYDLINGLVGIGVYALERLPRGSGEEILARVVRQLEATADRVADGVTWFTPPERLWRPLREAVAPNGFFNLGVSHGVGGVIPLLASACAVDVEASTARRLLDRAVAWLFSQRLTDSEVFCFPDFVGPGVKPRGSMLAWCYGDVGIAVTLLRAARLAGESAWEEQALDLARRITSLPREKADTRDCTLCHGAIGMGHQLNRLFHATGDPVFRDRSLEWYERGLDQRQPGQGVGGFVALEPVDYSGELRQVPRRGFLVGSAGIALGLLAANSPLEPAWDRLLLLS